MAPEKENPSEWKWLEYTLYAAALAFVLIAAYQLISTHRIVLLERETYSSTQTDADATTVTAQDQQADDGGA